MGKYKVLIIGCGNQGALADAKGSGNEHKVISFAHALKEREDVFETYLYDVDMNKANDACCLWDMNIDDDSVEYDVVIVTTPDTNHYDTLMEIVKHYDYKPRLVICEKPMCMTTSETRDIINRYEDAGIPILVNYTRRFIPEFREMIGKGYNAGTCEFNRGWEHTAAHFIDLCNMLNIDLCETDVGEVTNKERYWNFVLYDKEMNSCFNERRIGDAPVHERYDFHMRYVIDNALNFLEGKGKLYCTASESLIIMETIDRLKGE